MDERINESLTNMLTLIVFIVFTISKLNYLDMLKGLTQSQIPKV